MNILRRAEHVEHILAFNGTADVERARDLARLEMTAWPLKQLSPAELELHARDWLQFIGGLEMKPAKALPYLVVTSWLGRN